MDASNKANILKLNMQGEIETKKVFLMRDFEKEIGNDKDVPAPYFGGEEGFQQVFYMLKRSCAAFLDFLIEKHQPHVER